MLRLCLRRDSALGDGGPKRTRLLAVGLLNFGRGKGSVEPQSLVYREQQPGARQICRRDASLVIHLAAEWYEGNKRKSEAQVNFSCDETPASPTLSGRLERHSAV